MPPGYFATDGTTIEVSQHNPPLEDIAQALTDSLPRDGSAPMTGNLNAASNKITNLAAATNAADAVRFDQVPVLTGLTATVTELNFTDGVTSPIQTQLDAKQGADATLTALAGLDSSTGLVAQTGTDTFTKRTITSTGGSVVVTNPGGVAGNINLEVSGNGSASPTAVSSGTSVTLVSGLATPPSYIRLHIRGLSTTAVGAVLLRLTVAATPVATGYTCEGETRSANARQTFVTGFGIYFEVATYAFAGTVTLWRVPGTNWWYYECPYLDATSAAARWWTAWGMIELASVDGLAIVNSSAGNFDGSGTIHAQWG